jgi:hypothetical protein
MIRWQELAEGMMSRITAKLLVAAAGMLLCSVSVSTGAALAGPTLENTQETTVGTQAIYDNNRGQSFQVTGNASINGSDGFIVPFSRVDSNPVTFPNSGTAVVNASVQVCQLTCTGYEGGGTVAGDAKITTSGSSNSILLNSSPTNGVTAITLETDKQPSTGFGAIITGDNIGTSSLQVQGIRRSISSNTLTVF